MISQELLSILGCPACEDRPGLIPVTDQDGEFLECRQCWRRYPFRDNIPVMLVDQAIRKQVDRPDKVEKSRDPIKRGKLET